MVVKRIADQSPSADDQVAETSAPTLYRLADLVSLITFLQPGDILFVDEIHRPNRRVEQTFYGALEEFQLDSVLAGGGDGGHFCLKAPQSGDEGCQSLRGGFSR